MGKGIIHPLKRVFYTAISRKEPIYKQMLQELIDKYYYPLVENISINCGLDIINVEISDFYTLTVNTKIASDRSRATVLLNKVVEYIEQESNKVAKNSLVTVQDSSTNQINFCLHLEIEE